MKLLKEGYSGKFYVYIFYCKKKKKKREGWALWLSWCGHERPHEGGNHVEAGLLPGAVGRSTWPPPSCREDRLLMALGGLPHWASLPWALGSCLAQGYAPFQRAAVWTRPQFGTALQSPPCSSAPKRSARPRFPRRVGHLLPLAYPAFLACLPRSSPGHLCAVLPFKSVTGQPSLQQEHLGILFCALV